MMVLSAFFGLTCLPIAAFAIGPPRPGAGLSRGLAPTLEENPLYFFSSRSSFFLSSS